MKTPHLETPKTPRLSVVIPVYLGGPLLLDVAHWLGWVELIQQSPKEIQWVITEIRTSTETLKLLPWLDSQVGTRTETVEAVCEFPSRTTSFNQAVQAASGETIILLHDDCLPEPGFWDLPDLGQAPLVWGGFYKRYDSNSWVLKASAWLQNQLRLRLFGQLVGTNSLVFPRSFWVHHPFEGDFLEDIRFCDQARKVLGRPVRYRGTLSVSPKRYDDLGVLRCLSLNLLILIAFRLGAPIHRLKKLYPSLKGKA